MPGPPTILLHSLRSRGAYAASVALRSTKPLSPRHLVEDLRKLHRARLFYVDLHALLERSDELGGGPVAHNGVAVIAPSAEEVRGGHILGEEQQHLQARARAGKVHELDLRPAEAAAPGSGGIILQSLELEHLQPRSHVGIEIERVDAKASGRAGEPHVMAPLIGDRARH